MNKKILENTLKVSISQGNRKMGAIPSVSLPPVITCKHCETCAGKCYAMKLQRIYKTVRESWARNYKIVCEDRNAYFDQITVSAMISGFFRFHVSGDILDIDYLDRMCKTARKCKNTRFLAFTKNYEDVNTYFETHKKPRNLQIIFSLPFDGSAIENPHNLPTAGVILKGSEPSKKWKICGGNCTECACRGVGCWELKKGETIGFYEH